MASPVSTVTPVTVTIAGLKWQIEPTGPDGRTLRLTAPPGFRVNWRTGIKVVNREWTTIELELEER